MNPDEGRFISSRCRRRQKHSIDPVALKHLQAISFINRSRAASDADQDSTLILQRHRTDVKGSRRRPFTRHDGDDEETEEEEG